MNSVADALAFIRFGLARLDAQRAASAR